MFKILAKNRQWLLPTVLILFILEVLTLPLVISITYGGRSESPDRILTYTENKLTWDNGAQIDENGTVQFSLFDEFYQSVKSDNGDDVVAPGTNGKNIVRLHNQVMGEVSYTAVLYRIRSSEDLPVEVSLSGDRFTDTKDYALPEGVSENDVIRAVTGTVSGSERQDFDVDWVWHFEVSDEQDELDTALGNAAAALEADTVTVGMYITVTDGNVYLPDSPQTGDNPMLGMYVALLGISGILLILLWISRRKEKEQEECAQ